MDKEIMLEKLQNLQDLLLENCRLRDYVESGCIRETLSELDDIRQEIGKFPKAPSVTACNVALPLPENHAQTAKKERDQRKLFLLGAAGITLLFLVLYFSTHAGALNTVSVICIFATAIVGWFFKMSNDVCKTKEKELQESQKKYKDSLARFQKALAAYPAETETGRQEHLQYRLRHYQHYPAFMDTVLGFEEKMEQARNALSENTEQLQAVDVVPAEYYHLVPTILSMLRSGRADTYKEALNMAIEEERQEAREAARQEEEARRLAAMERQMEEERRHNEMMERQQAEHDRAMERAANAQAEEQRRARIQAEKDQRRAESEAFHQKTIADSEARKQAAATRSAGISKCANCRNNRRCPTHVKESGAGLTCGGYQPY